MLQKILLPLLSLTILEIRKFFRRLKHRLYMSYISSISVIKQPSSERIRNKKLSIRLTLSEGLLPWLASELSMLTLSTEELTSSNPCKVEARSIQLKLSTCSTSLDRTQKVRMCVNQASTLCSLAFSHPLKRHPNKIKLRKRWMLTINLES
jgi:hypothetical protein